MSNIGQEHFIDDSPEARIARLAAERDQWKERAEVVECLARRICRDLRHALDDIPATNPLKEMMVERYRQFKTDLGDTSEYVHALHYSIRRLQYAAECWSAFDDAGLVDIRIGGQEFTGISDMGAWARARLNREQPSGDKDSQ